MHDGRPEETWTADERELTLTSQVDISKIKLKGPASGVVGEKLDLTLYTYDDKGRRRSTGGDRFTCALRSPGTPDLCACELLNVGCSVVVAGVAHPESTPWKAAGPEEAIGRR